VGWFNHRRLYEDCGDVPPAELEVLRVTQRDDVGVIEFVMWDR
jgi:putative transposase